MARVFLPKQMTTGMTGPSEFVLEGSNLGQLIEELEIQLPGIRNRIVQGDRLAPGISLVVDGSLAGRGLWTEIGPNSEVHFLPAISGGSPAVGHRQFNES